MGKLLKYDACSIAKVALPIYFAMVLSSMLAVLLDHICNLILEKNPDAIFATMPLEMLALFSALFTMIGAAFVCFYGLYRYCKSVFSDEGYLTLALPQPLTRIFSAKYGTGIFFAAVTLIFYWLLNLLTSWISAGKIVTDAMMYYPYMIESESLAYLYWLFSDLSMLVTLLACLTILYFSFTFTALFLRRARAFVAICIAFGIFLVTNLVTSFFTMLDILPDETPVAGELFFTTGISFFFFLAVTAVLFIVTRYIFDKHMNLE